MEGRAHAALSLIRQIFRHMAGRYGFLCAQATLLASDVPACTQARVHLRCALNVAQEMESVEIDQGGTYKYVLLRLQSLQSKEHSQLLVRGSRKAGYHRDIVHSEQHLLANDDCKVSTHPPGYFVHYLVEIGRGLLAICEVC